MIEYQVLRSRRKTLTLQVKHGQVYVRAPLHLDEEFISSFIQKKSVWLEKKIIEQNQSVELCCNFTEGSKMFFLGQLVTLSVTFAKSGEKAGTFLSNISSEHQMLIVVLSKHVQRKSLNEIALSIEVKKQLERFLKHQAQLILPPKIEYYSKLTNLEPTGIKIRQYSARWGSCNNRGELSFNYLLMMLPMHIIDYVIIHELCHLRHLNHSKPFWQLVSEYFPNYVEAKKWIKSHQSALHWRSPV